MRKSIKEVLMQRDGMTAEQAEMQIDEAREALGMYLEEGDEDGAERVCEEYFGLEPDYLDDLL